MILIVFFFSSRRRHTRCALVTGVQTCALPIFPTPYVSQSQAASRSMFGSTDDPNQADPKRLMDLYGVVSTLFAIVHATSEATGRVDWRLYRKSLTEIGRAHV